jgi:hypothetical protein
MCQAQQVVVVVIYITCMETLLGLVVVVDGLQSQLWVVKLCCLTTTYS